MSGLFSRWFADHGADEVAAALARTSILWERYRSFAETAAGPKVTANPLFAPLEQPGVGTYLAPGLPFSIDGVRTPAVPAPALGDDTAAVLAERCGITPEQLSRLSAAGTVETDGAPA